MGKANRILVILAVLMVAGVSKLAAQASFEITPEMDRLIRSGMEDMYSYRLQAAAEKFDQLIRRFPDHPIGYVYRSQIEWWKALRDNTNLTYAANFDAYANRATEKAKALIEKDPKDFYALLYLASAYGCQVRFEIMVRGRTRAAVVAGKAGYKAVCAARQLRQEYVDLLLGIGAWNYFTGDLPAILKPLLFLLGVRGNKDLGKQQLRTVAEKGEYAQLEAKIVLLGVAVNEKLYQEWISQLETLIMKYPSNPVFYNWLGGYYSKGEKWSEGIQKLLALREKLQAQNPPVFTNEAASYIVFNLGNLELGQKNLDRASDYFTQALTLNPTDGVIAAMANLLRGNCYHMRNDRDKAIRDYEEVLRLPSVGKNHEEALQGLRELGVKN
jgi:hypothetical protein